MGKSLRITSLNAHIGLPYFRILNVFVWQGYTLFLVTFYLQCSLHMCNYKLYKRN